MGLKTDVGVCKISLWSILVVEEFWTVLELSYGTLHVKVVIQVPSTCTCTTGCQLHFLAELKSSLIYTQELVASNQVHSQRCSQDLT